jgi:hypothetical protein
MEQMYRLYGDIEIFLCTDDGDNSFGIIEQAVYFDDEVNNEFYLLLTSQYKSKQKSWLKVVKNS